MLDFLAPFWNTLIFNPMVNLLLWLYTAIGNYGIAIIIFTLIIRVITLPFYAQQQKAMKKQQALTKSKEWQDMQKKFAKDKEKLAQEQMRLYRRKFRKHQKCVLYYVEDNAFTRWLGFAETVDGRRLSA